MPPSLTYRIETEGGATVTVRGGRIAPPGSKVDLVVPCPGRIVRPGLINPHDHLHRNHFPRLGSPPYADAYAWGEDLHRSCAEVIERGRAVDRRDALLFGALKNLVAGVTTVVHHDPWHPLLDRAFPVRVARVRVAHSLVFDPQLGDAFTGDPELPFSIHLAEGVTERASREVEALAARGLVDDRLLAVHLVGVSSDGIEMLREARSAIVWCPSSNRYLFGRTAPEALLRSGLDVLVGSDSLLTADGTLLDELRLARELGVLHDDELLDGVGPTAARRLGIEAPSLEPGAPADLVVLRRPPLEATAADVTLVVVGGEPRYGDPDLTPLFEAARIRWEPIHVAGGRRLVVEPLGTVGARIGAAWPEAARLLGVALVAGDS